MQLLAEEAGFALPGCLEETAEHEVLQTRSAVVLRCPEAKEVRVPLALAEVGSAAGEEACVVALARPARPDDQGDAQDELAYDLWLLTANCGPEGLRSILGQLGEAGAIRGDLTNAFDVARQPFGSGASAKIYEVRAPRSGEAGERPALFAAKAMLVEERQRLCRADTETALLARVQGHPNVTRLRGVFYCLSWPDPEDSEEDKREERDVPMPRQVILTDLCRRGNIYSYVRHHDAFAEDEALEVITGLLAALVHIHARGVLHRDVTSPNVLLDSACQPVLTDFGVAALLSDAQALQRRCGTPGYTAPEVLAQRPPQYSRKVDVFGAGVVLYFCLHGRTPFSSATRDVDEVLQRSMECHVSFPPLPEITEQARHFTRILLTKDVDDRPTASAAIEMLKLLDFSHVRKARALELQADAVGAQHSLPSEPQLKPPGSPRRSERPVWQRLPFQPVVASSSERSSESPRRQESPTRLRLPFQPALPSYSEDGPRSGTLGQRAWSKRAGSRPRAQSDGRPWESEQHARGGSPSPGGRRGSFLPFFRSYSQMSTLENRSEDESPRRDQTYWAKDEEHNTTPSTGIYVFKVDSMNSIPSSRASSKSPAANWFRRGSKASASSISERSSVPRINTLLPSFMRRRRQSVPGAW